MAIKIHFGELGNLAFLRPNFARYVADYVKELGGYPFLTDCNTLYVGSRKNALDHLDTALRNGFSPYATGCQILIADGLKGTDDVEVPVATAAFSARPPKSAGPLWTPTSSSPSTTSRATSAPASAAPSRTWVWAAAPGPARWKCTPPASPSVDHDLCVGCGACVKICAHGAPHIADKRCTIDHTRCAGCGRCIGVCPKDAITPRPRRDL